MTYVTASKAHGAIVDNCTDAPNLAGMRGYLLCPVCCMRSTQLCINTPCAVEDGPPHPPRALDRQCTVIPPSRTGILVYSNGNDNTRTRHQVNRQHVGRD
jgi:hypothetical protein